jgi:hypothetical protein
MKKLLLCLCIFAVGCKQKETIQFNQLHSSTKKEQYTYQECALDSPYCTSLKASYPVFEKNNPELDHFLNDQIRVILLTISDSEEVSSINALRDTLFTRYEAFKLDIPDSKLPFTQDIQISLVGGKDSILSIECVNYQYYAGAHGSTWIKYYNIDLKNKTLLSSTYFNIKNPSLMQTADKAFRKQNAIPEQQSYSEAGYFWEGDGYPEGAFRLNTNYFFRNDSVFWLYNQYEIAAYAMGTPQVGLPLQTVQSLQP